MRGYPGQAGPTDEAFAKAIEEMEAEDNQTSRSPRADKVRARAMASLSPLVGDVDARTIVEALGGTIGQARLSALAIARIIDRVLVQQRAREDLLRCAETSSQAGAVLMLKSYGTVEPEQSGYLRGLAWRAYDDAAQAIQWSREVGRE